MDFYESKRPGHTGNLSDSVAIGNRIFVKYQLSIGNALRYGGRSGGANAVGRGRPALRNRLLCLSL